MLYIVGMGVNYCTFDFCKNFAVLFSKFLPKFFQGFPNIFIGFLDCFAPAFSVHGSASGLGSEAATKALSICGAEG